VGQKILVVEDNELNLRLFCDLLRAHGYETEPVRDGREALERARAFVPDLVVMDIQMPHVSGLELIELMKRDDGLKRTPIMAVTAYAAKGDEERIRDAGAEGYVSKPISVLRFVEAVAGLLRTAGERTGDAAAAEAVKAAEGSEAIEAEVKAEGPAAEARAIEAAAGSEEVVKDAAAAAEDGEGAAETPGDGRQPDSAPDKEE
jgi:two-component system cell cycle response regulator DivK